MTRIMIVSIFLAALGAGAVLQVNMVGISFVPETLTINEGDTVRWVNASALNHTSTSGVNGVPDGIWDSGIVGPGDTFAFAFDTLGGNFPYYCTPHWSMGMIGLIISIPRVVLEESRQPAITMIRARPNPFTDRVEIGFEATTGGMLVVRVFNNLGQAVRHLDGVRVQSGYQTLTWNGKDDAGRRLPSGVYTVLIELGPMRIQRQVVLRAP